MAILLLSQGVPMLLAGDELLRTKQGNNNTYCQNNDLSWIDWRLADDNRDMLDFTRAMIAFRKRHPTLRRERFLTGKPDREGAPPDITWHGTELNEPAGTTATPVLAFMLAGLAADEPHLHVMLNMWMTRWTSRCRRWRAGAGTGPWTPPPSLRCSAPEQQRIGPTTASASARAASWCWRGVSA
jgi:pullulanase/glycogen debranching enzyme